VSIKNVGFFALSTLPSDGSDVQFFNTTWIISNWVMSSVAGQSFYFSPGELAKILLDKKEYFYLNPKT
jgi:hypothetical protein